jgi:beta-lactamase regulating signal transducer with metallopeptidase domain
MTVPTATFFTPADSARAVSDVYGVSLVATMPIVAAMVAFLYLRRSTAGTRAIVWRCTLVGLLAMYAGQFLPWQWMAWILPELLARPLVALGTVQLDMPPGISGVDASTTAGPGVLRGLLIMYWIVVALMLLRTGVARVRLTVVRRRAMTLSGPVWRTRLGEAGRATGVSTEAIRLLASPEVPVPATWGIRRPVILLPRAAMHWPAGQIQAVLRHELAHVRARDAAMHLTARIACALFWFHPGVWWLARRFDTDAEEACDDRVLLSGVRASDYAEWLAASIPGADRPLEAAMALVRRGHLRARLAAITNPRRRVAVPGRRAAVCAMAFSAVIVTPLATARLAPTREVLTRLMLESRWESRAWAVVRLAQRADSVDVARSVARHDPDPAVRAWARYALSRGPALPTSRPRS